MICRFKMETEFWSFWRRSFGTEVLEPNLEEDGTYDILVQVVIVSLEELCWNVKGVQFLRLPANDAPLIRPPPAVWRWPQYVLIQQRTGQAVPLNNFSIKVSHYQFPKLGTQNIHFVFNSLVQIILILIRTMLLNKLNVYDVKNIFSSWE